MPQPVHPITLPLIVPAWLPARDNKPLLFFMKRTQKATIKKKKSGITAKSLATLLHFFFSRRRLLMCAANWKKAKVLLTAALSHVWIGENIFSYSVYGSVKVITWEGGFVCADNRRFCVEQTGDIGIIKNRAAMSTETTKASSHSHPICGNTKKKQWRMSPIAASNWIIQNIQPHVTQSHLRASEMRLSRRLSLTDSLFFFLLY